MTPTATIRRVTTVVHQTSLGWRVYRRTPASLRRPEPALRASLLGVSIWFAAFFALLAYVALQRTVTPDESMVGLVMVVVGYAIASAAGIGGAGLAITRRYRSGGYALGAAVVVGQAITVLAVA